MPTYRIDLAYDGTGFHGFARQLEVRTVQETFEEALFHLTGPVAIAVAGRTDSGVHARGQVVSFAVAEPVDEALLVRSLNKQLNPEIAITEVRRVADGFHARFSAESRTYRYLVWNWRFSDPFLRHTAWHVPDPLTLDQMNTAAQHFVGIHDFASFCRSAPGRQTERSVESLRWIEESEGLFRFEITASSYCHQMVRAIVAYCVEVGRGRLSADDTPGVIAALDRNAACGSAPPRGLTLWSVTYPALPGRSPWTSTS